MKKIAGVIASVSLIFTLTVLPVMGQKANIALTVLGTYQTGVFDEGAAEISAYDPETYRLFVINADDAGIDVLSLADPTNPTLLFSIDVTPFGDKANSVAVKNGVLVAAIESDPKTDPGSAVFFDADGNYINDVEVGALPDMITYTPNGSYVLVANEGEPNDDYSIDPEGSVSVIDLRKGVENATVSTAGFGDWETKINRCPAGIVGDPSTSKCVRIFGANAPTVAQDLEPEYIAVNHNSKKAYVTLQENNALAIVDIPSATVESVVGLGFKNHSETENALDPSDRDGAINIDPWPVWGMYQPDAIAAVKYKNRNYYITANEGDAREYIYEDSQGNEIEALVEESRVKSLTLDQGSFDMDVAELQADDNLGRLNVTNTMGYNANGEFEQLFSFGARSISVWDDQGNQVYDSGDAIEQITAAAYPNDFNSNNDENDSFESRSDNKGPEPEGVVVAKIFGRSYAFVCLERIGGIMIYDVTLPTSPQFIQYLNNRDFSVDAETPGGDTNPAVGDLGPEGIIVISGGDSPTGQPLLVVANEVSGTTTVYGISKDGIAPTPPIFSKADRQ